MIELNAYISMNLIAALVLFISAALVLKKEGLSAGKILFIAGISILLFFIGARLLYGILYPQKILEDPGKLFEWKLVNFSLYGGLVLSLGSFFLLAKYYRLPFMKITDHIVPALGIAIALSKMGCFFNGCCYGIQTHLPWGVVFDRAEQSPVTKAFGNSPFIRMISGTVDVPRHPTQLYEVIFALLAAFVAYQLLKSIENNNKKFNEKRNDLIDHKRLIITGTPTLLFIILLTIGRWVSFAFRDFPYASGASNFVRGPLTYAVILCLALFWLIRRAIRITPILPITPIPTITPIQHNKANVDK